MYTFSIKEAIKHGWELFKSHTKLALIASLLALVVGSLRNSVRWGESIFISLGLILLEVFINIGVTKLYLKIVDGIPVEINEIFKHGNKIINYLCVVILFGIGTVVGLILLIVPGVYFFLRYIFAPIIMVDKEVSIGGAFKQSADLTKDLKLKLLGFCIMLLLVNILGAVCLLVGLLVSVPVSCLAFTHVYRKLQSNQSVIVTA